MAAAAAAAGVAEQQELTNVLQLCMEALMLTSAPCVLQRNPQAMKEGRPETVYKKA